MPTEPAYAPVQEQDDHNNNSPATSPRLGSPELRAAPSSPRFIPPPSPSLGTFSSAQAYLPLSPDGEHGLRSQSRQSQPFLATHQSTNSFNSRPHSRASSHLLMSDYDSVHQLNRYSAYSEQQAIPLQSYDKEDSSLNGSGRKSYHDPRAAGLARYGVGSDVKRQGMSTKKKWIIFALVVVVLIIIAIAVAVPLLAIQSSHGGGGNSPGRDSTGHNLLTSGGNGTTIKMENGTEFTYINNFGGEWHSGLNDNGARAQSYTPRMNETWDYARDRMLGVNLGGWLVIEPFIVPALFEKYENDSSKYVVDEYTLTQQWINEGGPQLAAANMKQHYDTFITEWDFAQIAAAGLNWVRLPIGYWAIAKVDNEPFVEGLAWNYVLKAVQWARKYGLRIELDLHGAPGSQNGYNHAGRLGVFNFLNSPAGTVAAQRTLDVIRSLTEFINQPDVVNVIPAFGILNEPNLPIGIGMDNIRRFYVETYSMIRNITGFGQGKGPMIYFHDGFMGLQSFAAPNGSPNFLAGSDRVGWDLHPYICFVPPFGPRSNLPVAACNGFQSNTEYGLNNMGSNIAGEWSLANNDCGLFLNGPFQGVRYDGSWSSGSIPGTGQCGPFDDWQSYNQSTKQEMMDGASAQMAAFHDWFFWTWKIGDSLRTGKTVNPNWNYLLGLQQGWMPVDPHSAQQNACAKLQATYPAITKTALNWGSTFADYQTGRASTYAPDTVSYSWPPPSMASSGTAPVAAATAIPSYTPTGPHITASFAMPTASVKNEASPSLNPWIGAAYTQPAFVPIAGCNYFPDILANVTGPVSGWPCSGAPPAKREYTPRRHLAVFQERALGPEPTPIPQRRRGRLVRLK